MSNSHKHFKNQQQNPTFPKYFPAFLFPLVLLKSVVIRFHANHLMASHNFILKRGA